MKAPAWALALIGLIAGCTDGSEPAGGETAPLRVFAAASLRDVMLEAGAELERRGLDLEFNFAGSNVLARQIEAAPGAADVFLSADERWIDYLDAKGHLRPDSRMKILSNRLVVVASSSSPLRVREPRDLASPEVRFLALAHPDAVPAGRYARAYLESAWVDGEPLWRRLEGRLAPAADVRAAVALVEARADVAGLVYATDARASDGVRILYEVPAGEGPPIGYFAAVIRESAQPDGAIDLVRYLASADAQARFERHGFVLPAVPNE